jgi:hypothetical protein
MAAEKPSINTPKKMDRVGNAIYSILSSDVQLNQLVANRIYPVIGRQREAYPLLTYSIITNNPSDTKTSASTVDQYRIQFDAYADDYDRVHDILIRLREVLDRYPHTVVAGIQLDGVRFIDQNDGYEEEGQLFRATSDYYIRVKRGPIEPALNECFDLQSFNFTLPAGDTAVDCGFLLSTGHLVFAGYLGPMVFGADYTVSGTHLTLADAPFSSDVAITIVRNRVRVRIFTQPSNTSEIYIGGLLYYPVLVFVGDTLQVAGVDYAIDIESLTMQWLNFPFVSFDFKIVANACQL